MPGLRRSDQWATRPAIGVFVIAEQKAASSLSFFIPSLNPVLPFLPWCCSGQFERHQKAIRTPSCTTPICNRAFGPNARRPRPMDTPQLTWVTHLFCCVVVVAPPSLLLDGSSNSARSLQVGDPSPTPHPPPPCLEQIGATVNTFPVIPAFGTSHNCRAWPELGHSRQFVACLLFPASFSGFASSSLDWDRFCSVSVPLRVSQVVIGHYG
jgi:hypothetical protein